MEEAQREGIRNSVKQFLAKWDARALQYRSVRFASAVARDSSGAWRNLVAYLLPLHKTHDGEHKGFAEYDNLKIASGVIGLEEARLIVENAYRRMFCTYRN